MGTLILISGENGSGKSLFAERVASSFNTPRYYIATMTALTPENHLRIQKHRKQREFLRFHTLELPFKVATADVLPHSTVLLEDASNLLANSLFEKNGTADSVFQDIEQLSMRCQTLIVVTISGLRAEDYADETAEYINALNLLNKKLFDSCATAVLMQNHTPVYQKGAAYDFD